MVARTTPARRAISAMLASGSLASASTAASRMRAMLRSASARRRGAVAPAVSWEARIVVLVHSDSRSEAHPRQEARGRGQHDQGDDTGDGGDAAGDQERVTEPARQVGGGGRPARGLDGAGGDSDEHRDAE